MNFNIKFNTHGPLNEVGQINPIRWQILRGLPQGGCETQAQIMKCTDYFNDLVALKVQGTKFSVHGFSNEQIKFEKDGSLLVHLTNLKDSFFKNMPIINERLKKDLGVTVEVLRDDNAGNAIIVIPDAVFRTTLRISALCWVIRLSNYGLVFTNWEDIFDNKASPANGPEAHLKGAATKKGLRKWGFGVPPGFEKYWWFYGASYNSEKDPNAKGTMIHNDGCAGWWNQLPQV